MATVADAGAATQEPTVEKRVYDALRKNGYKFSDLPDEARDRALNLKRDDKVGLLGKALVNWIVDGKDLKEQVKEAEAAREVAETAAKTETRAKSAGARSAYPQPVRDAVKRANEIRGKGHGAGPKQHATVREVVRKQLKLRPTQDPTVDQLVEISGAGSVAKLTKLANGQAGREDLKALRPLASLMGDDAWCKGRHLAAALAAWAEQIKAAGK